MRLLVVFLLAELGCSLTEGRIFSKCELRNKLMKAIHELPERAKEKGLTESLVPRIVCHAEFASGFNTSAVNQLNSGTGKHHSKTKTDSSYGGMFGMAQLEEDVWTLNGIFQLGTRLVCSNGSTPSVNLCMTDCSKLIDDDIHDDIKCVFRILTELLEKGFGAPHWEMLKRMVRLIYQEECKDRDFSGYFNECPQT